MSYPVDSSPMQAAPEHEQAIAVLEEARDDAVQKLEALNGKYRDALAAADAAQDEALAQQSLVDNYFTAIATLSAPSQRVDAGRPAPRPIRDNPQA